MTDRHAGYVVTLAKDIREDDAESILNAIRMVKGVATVTPVVSDIGQHIAEERAHLAIQSRIFDLFREMRGR